MHRDGAYGMALEMALGGVRGHALGVTIGLTMELIKARDYVWSGSRGRTQGRTRQPVALVQAADA